MEPVIVGNDNFTQRRVGFFIILLLIHLFRCYASYWYTKLRLSHLTKQRFLEKYYLELPVSETLKVWCENIIA